MGGETVDPGLKAAETSSAETKAKPLLRNTSAESASQSSSPSPLQSPTLPPPQPPTQPPLQPPPDSQATEADHPQEDVAVAKGHESALVVSGSQHNDQPPFAHQVSSPQPEMSPAPRMPLHHGNATVVTRPQGPYQTEPYRYGVPTVGAPPVLPNARGPFPIQTPTIDQHAAPGQFYPTAYTMPIPHFPPMGPPLRPDLSYYPNPASVNQAPYPAAPYYYAPGHQLPVPAMYVQAQPVVGHQHYGMPTAPQFPVPRQGQHSPGYETAPGVPPTQNYTPPASQSNGWPSDGELQCP